MMISKMERINRILHHPMFRECMAKNEAAETDRIFCKHDVAHFMDVARIGQIVNLEEAVDLEPELIYAAALVHDIGRHVQYADGTPHEKASAVLAPKILAECGFDDKETGVIVDAVLHHRDVSVKEERNLRGILYRADKLSRACYACKAEAMCDWKKDKKNLEIVR